MVIKTVTEMPADQKSTEFCWWIQ